MSGGTCRLVCKGATHVGLRREVNEDCLLVAPETGALAVADGMGGHAAGEVASGIVIDTLREFLGQLEAPDSPASAGGGSIPEPERLRTAIRMANERIFKSIEQREELRGMGTTIVVALVQGDRLTIGSVGDSRAYLLRDGVLRQLTADHSWVQEQVDLGLLSPSEAHRHPFRNIVTRALGSREEVAVDIREEQWGGTLRTLHVLAEEKGESRRRADLGGQGRTEQPAHGLFGKAGGSGYRRTGK